MTTRQSTQEEIDARQAEAAAYCPGDGVHTNDLRLWHDWRLWQRDPRYEHMESGYTCFSHYHEVWYCTRCRKIEQRDAT